MAHKGYDHSTWPDIRHSDMVAVFLDTGHQSYIDLGFEQKAPAHTGGIQHTVGVDILYGPSTTFGKITCT